MQKAEGCQQQEAEGAEQGPLTLHGPISCVAAASRSSCPPLRLLPLLGKPSLEGLGAVWLRLPTGSPPDTSPRISRCTLTILITGELFTR